jgi:hypothetical protein
MVKTEVVSSFHHIPALIRAADTRLHLGLLCAFCLNECQKHKLGASTVLLSQAASHLAQRTQLRVRRLARRAVLRKEVYEHILALSLAVADGLGQLCSAAKCGCGRIKIVLSRNRQTLQLASAMSW